MSVRPTARAELCRQIQARVAAQRDPIIRFMREICAIPSMNSQIGPVGERIAAEMRALRFDEVRFDKMGNILGRIGHGPTVLVYDSHIDTVGIGDRDTWEWDPFEGKVENDLLYARGACDEKGSTPGMVYGLALARDLGLLDGLTVYYFGNMEEWCDGIAPNSFVEVDPRVRPDFVVIGEPTKMQIYRGHKGRVELKVSAHGRSAHAASHHLGDNAVYKMLAVIAGIRDLDARLPSDPFLGKATIAVTDARTSTASINAVPDGFTIFIDRRITFGETKEQAVEQIRALIPPDQREDIQVEELFYDEPSYTGFVFPVDKYFPPWALGENHLLVVAGQDTATALWGNSPPAGKWSFSTNGTYWAGKADIPSIGFGPGEEEWAHAHNEHIRLDDVVRATEWYALFPSLLPPIA
ncbi:MAG: YgeY family selenium metabolism-linked hydrolase [Anaerolineales bacterium]|nr:YgeY family selenium metabolism-linked hydrolase [Anaerolineales bacterium]